MFWLIENENNINYLKKILFKTLAWIEFFLFLDFGTLSKIVFNLINYFDYHWNFFCNYTNSLFYFSLFKCLLKGLISKIILTIFTLCNFPALTTLILQVLKIEEIQKNRKQLCFIVSDHYKKKKKNSAIKNTVSYKYSFQAIKCLI